MRAILTAWCQAVNIRQQLGLSHTGVTHQADIDVPWEGAAKSEMSHKGHCRGQQAAP